MKTRILLTTLIILSTATVYAEDNDDYPIPQPGETLQYNALEDRFESAPPNSKPVLNPIENEFELAPDNHQLKYNAMEDRHEVATPDATLKYNPHSDEFEYRDNPNSSQEDED